MAYRSHNITAITDIPALIGAFASDIGWETNSDTPTQPIITRPQGFDSNSMSNSDESYDSIRWRITASVAGSVHTLRTAIYDPANVFSGIVTSEANFTSPRLTAGTLTPHTLYLIGSLSPEPYIAAVVEYPGQTFRHMYIGYAERIGNYQGGEIIAATEGPAPSNSNTVAYDDPSHMKYLFGSRSSRKSASESGGVYVQHAENPTPWRRFIGNSSVSNIHLNMPAGAVVGGYGDSINDGYLARGRSPFAGQTILTPINLYLNDAIIGDMVYRPIGRPAGVRLVNMQDLNPGAEIVVGGKLWRVYPSHCRRFESSMPRTGTGTQPRNFESSYWVGYAYAVDEEDSNSGGA